MENTLFLGKGFVSQVAHQKGATLLSRQLSSEPRIHKWDPEVHLSSLGIFQSYLESELDHRFSDVQVIVLTFPATHLTLIQMEALSKFCQNYDIKLIILGSWSSIQGETQVGPVTFELIDSQERNQAELRLLDLSGSHGVRILLAGIWGIGRSPANWLKKGLISKQKPSVNLVHPEDICEFIQIARKKDLHGSIALCDGHEAKWEEIEEFLKEKSILSNGFKRLLLPIKRPTRYILAAEFEEYYNKLQWIPQRKYSPALDLELNPN